MTALTKIGRTLTDEIYLRQQEGPWPPALKKAIPPLEGREVLLSYRGRIPIIESGPSPRIRIEFNDQELEIIGEVLERFGYMDNRGIKVSVYRTPPMRYVLKQEKLGRDMRRVPVLYKNMTAPEHDKLISKTIE